MNLAETAKLIIQLDLKGNAAAGIAKVRKELSGLDSAATGRIGQGFRTLGTGLGVAFLNGAKIAVGAIGGIIGAIGVMAKEGQEAARVQIIFATAIKNSGKISTDYVKILNDQQKALMNLSGINDEAIKSVQTMLIQMDLTGEQVAKTTPLVLDFAEATGIDLETAAKLTGKSINGLAGSLSRYGVFVDKAKFKTDPYVATIEALNKKFGGTTQALSGELDTKLKVFNENLANIREEAGIKLLPALTRIVDIAGKKLVPAFGKFIDRILPSLIKGMNQFADLLESGGVEKGINAITDAIGPMVSVLQMAVGPVKAIVGAFLKLPQKVQAALISGFIINKLSGGLVASGGKDILGGVGSLIGPAIGAAFQGVLQKVGFTKGSSPLNPLFVSDIQNRLPNGQFAPGFMPTTLGKIVSLIPATLVATAIIGAAIPIGEAFRDALPDWLKGPGGKGESDSQRAQTLARAAAGLGTRTDPQLLNRIDKETRDVTAAQRATTDAVRELPSRFRTALGGILFNPNAPSRPGKDDSVIVTPRIHIPIGAHRAAGGPVMRGLGYIVGETGPEWFAPGENGQIIPVGKRANDYRPPRPYNPDDFSQSLEGRQRAEALRRLAGLHSRSVGPDDRSHPNLGGLMGRRELRDPRFVSSAILDPSQLQDRRGSSYLMGRMREYRYLHRDQSENGDRFAIKVTTSTRDQTTAAIKRGRWGPTPAQVGAT